MIVLQYIKEALFEHSCVIVPNFGGFLSEELPASINPINHLCKSPTTELAFNPSLIKDDGLLRSELSIGEEITLEESSEIIKVFVQEINEQLEQQETVVLKGLGEFSMIENNLTYKPQQLENFNIEAFGLGEFNLETIERNTEEMKQVRPVQPARRVVKRTPVVAEVKKEKVKKAESKSDNKKSIFLLLPLIMMLSVGGFIGYKIAMGDDHPIGLAHNESEVHTDQAGLLSSLDHSSSEDAQISESNDEEINIAASAIEEENVDLEYTEETKEEIVSEVLEEEYIDESIEEESVLVEEEIAEEEIVEETPVEEVYTSSTNNSLEVINSPMNKHHIIVNAFSSLENAKNYAAKIDGAQIIQPSGLYKISVARYNNESDAISAKAEYKAQYGHDVWVANY